MSELVDVLRDAAPMAHAIEGDLKHPLKHLLIEAADEIESLRAEVAYLKTRLAWHEGTIRG